MHLSQGGGRESLLVKLLEDLLGLELQIFLQNDPDIFVGNRRSRVLQHFEDLGEFPWHHLVEIAQVLAQFQIDALVGDTKV